MNWTTNWAADANLMAHEIGHLVGHAMDGADLVKIGGDSDAIHGDGAICDGVFVEHVRQGLPRPEASLLTRLGGIAFSLIADRRLDAIDPVFKSQHPLVCVVKLIDALQCAPHDLQWMRDNKPPQADAEAALRQAMLLATWMRASGMLKALTDALAQLDGRTITMNTRAVRAVIEAPAHQFGIMAAERGLWMDPDSIRSMLVEAAERPGVDLCPAILRAGSAVQVH